MIAIRPMLASHGGEFCIVILLIVAGLGAYIWAKHSLRFERRWLLGGVVMIDVLAFWICLAVIQESHLFYAPNHFLSPLFLLTDYRIGIVLILAMTIWTTAMIGLASRRLWLWATGRQASK
jgi:hypothetical protein